MYFASVVKTYPLVYTNNNGLCISIISSFYHPLAKFFQLNLSIFHYFPAVYNTSTYCHSYTVHIRLFLNSLQHLLSQLFKFDCFSILYKTYCLSCSSLTVSQFLTIIFVSIIFVHIRLFLNFVRDVLSQLFKFDCFSISYNNFSLNYICSYLIVSQLLTAFIITIKIVHLQLFSRLFITLIVSFKLIEYRYFLNYLQYLTVSVKLVDIR